MAKKATKIWNMLIEPGKGIDDEDQRRLSKTLAILLIMIFPIIILIGIVIIPIIEKPTTFWDSSTFQPASLAAISTIVSYALNRSGKYNLALWLYIIVFVFAPWWATLRTNTIEVFPIGLLMLGGVMMASTLSKDWTFLVSMTVLSTISVAIIPPISGFEFIKIIPLLCVVANLNIIILILTYYRNILEADRINARLHIEGKLREYTLELEDYKSTLEQKVDDRTKALTESNRNLRELQSQVVQSEKMAAIGTLSAGIGHEINNPLNFIKNGAVNLSAYLQEQNQHDKNTVKLLSIIDEGVKRTSAIVQKLAYLRTNNKGKKERCDVAGIIAEVTEALSKQTPPEIAIKTSLKIDKLVVLGNAHQLHTVFFNIIHNAIQAIPVSGEVHVEGTADQSNVVLRIRDTGKGISEADLSKVMDPFFTTKDPEVGTGLGLSVAFSIVKEHNGSLNIESTLNKGTTIVVTLPVDYAE